jgi:hypothetical protein
VREHGMTDGKQSAVTDQPRHSVHEEVENGRAGNMGLAQLTR